ncbi:GNAT family N-acetyltransferase [Nodosilinea sp. LEGE 07088]|uniref:GNAT family N-acetyltransferase n=1 Tax=Nodosilinea sp. LEGE 07088 TaxID=2777968 RepID=UPI001882B80B|nr:GNAT family N-acetyltransferase [Nodosilinea sp. LEGE 07088]MBE9139534.1 GNAT family N-acetyltransferase [Nodosilinea sp. LEGE 07088]
MVWLETQRLILRDFTLEDVPQLAPILSDPRVMKFSPKGVLSTAETQEKIEEFIALYQSHGFGKWAVIFKQTNQLIGYCGIALEHIDGINEPEIGYRLEPAFWGQGLATEAAKPAINYGLDQLQLPYLLGIVEPANTASVKILKKLGLEYDRNTVLHGSEVDIYRLNATIS